MISVDHLSVVICGSITDSHSELAIGLIKYLHEKSVNEIKMSTK